MEEKTARTRGANIFGFCTPHFDSGQYRMGSGKKIAAIKASEKRFLNLFEAKKKSCSLAKDDLKEKEMSK